MMDRKTLETTSKVAAAEAGTLPDLSAAAATEDETPAQRLGRCLAQTDSPYCVRAGQTPVRLLFHNEEKPLSEKLRSYFLSLKNGDF